MDKDELDVNFALVKALELAEGGSNIRERRIGEGPSAGTCARDLALTPGYLFLRERIKVYDELALMMINTIRKVSLTRAHCLHHHNSVLMSRI